MPWEVLSGEIVRHVRRAVGFDGWCLSLTDPATALPTVVVGTEGSPLASCQRRFWQLEYLVPDVCKASALAASALPVGALSHETGGDLACSQRWDELLRPADAADELRAVLNADGAPWDRSRCTGPGGREPGISSRRTISGRWKPCAAR